MHCKAPKICCFMVKQYSVNDDFTAPLKYCDMF